MRDQATRWQGGRRPATMFFDCPSKPNAAEFMVSKLISRDRVGQVARMDQLLALIGLDARAQMKMRGVGPHARVGLGAGRPVAASVCFRPVGLA